MAEFLTFFGGDHHAGTTLLAYRTAALLHEQGKRVLLLYASQEGFEGWLGSGSSGFDRLLHAFPPGTAELEAAITKGEPDAIYPTPDLLAKPYFRPELIKSIKAYGAKKYDVIVADGGCDASLPLPAACLAWADRRCYVCTGNAKALVRFGESYRTVIKGLGLDTSGDVLLLNKAGESPLLADAAALREAFVLRTLTMPCSSDAAVWELKPQLAFSKEPQAGALRALLQALQTKAGDRHE